MQVLARRKTGVVLREQTTPGPGEDCPFLLVFVVPLQANWRTKSKFGAINNTFSGVYYLVGYLVTRNYIGYTSRCDPRIQAQGCGQVIRDRLQIRHPASTR